MSSRPVSRKAQANLIRQTVENDRMAAIAASINDEQTAAPDADFAEVARFNLKMNDWLWARKDVLDYYKLVDAVNASIYQASDKRAKMNEWREWATKTRLALRYLDELVALGHNIVGVGQMELMWNIRSFNEKILSAWAEFDALRGGLIEVEPVWADADESGQRFDDNYVPF
jgi:hypothetical protein